MSEMMHTGAENMAEEWLDDDGQDEYADEQEGYYQPHPVRVEMEATQRVAPESTSWLSYVVPLFGQTPRPLQLLPHKYHRYKAKFLWTATAASVVFISRTEDALMGNALGNIFQMTIGAATVNSIPILPDYDGQQPLYCVCTVGGVIVSVMDESYKAVQ